jgi:5-methylcytosine-specific restriction endonuclease McrA
MREFDRQEWIMRALRRLSYRYPPRNAAKVSARIARGIYRCAICQGEVKHKDLQMDHIVPVAGPEGFIDWNDHIDRLLPEQGGWAAVHKECHQSKTTLENAERRINRNKKNDNS